MDVSMSLLYIFITILMSHLMITYTSPIVSRQLSLSAAVHIG